LRQLQAVQGVIQTNNVLPILDHYLFDVEGRQLTICTTDLNTTMRTRLAVEGNGQAKVAVPGKILLETLKIPRHSPWSCIPTRVSSNCPERTARNFQPCRR
jgi:DNA polymerase III sliding clamp (beta) subunit (PCNA family)